MRNILLLPIFLILTGCAGLHYNEASQQRNYQVRDITITVIDKSREDYSQNKIFASILDSIYSYSIKLEGKRGKTNIPTINMWKNVDAWVNGNFITVWQKENQLSDPSIDEMKKRAVRLFDYIINLENSKVK